MSVIEEFVVSVQQQGIQLWLDEQGQLRFRAQRGSLTPDLQATLKARKEAIVAFLHDAQDRPTLPQAIADPERSAEPFPLTAVQEAYWLGRREAFALHSPAHFYDEYASYGLDPARLEHTWQALIARHPMLRTTFLASGEQQVMAQVPIYTIPVDDLAQADADMIARHLERVRATLFAAPFAPEHWPLFGLRITRLPDGELRIHLALDMLIADWGSSAILLREWGQLYRDPERSLPVLHLTFRDYVLAKRRIRQTDLYRQAERYWRQRLADLPPAPELPLASDPAQVTATRFRHYERTVDAARWTRLKAGASQRGLTATGLALTLFAEVIARWSKHPRFTLNLTLFNRLPVAAPEEVNRLVGDFTSLTMLEIDHRESSTTLAERGKRLQGQLWRDIEQRYFSGVEVLRARSAQPGRGSQGMPVIFTSGLGVADEDSAWLGEVVHSFSQTPQVWLDCQVREQTGHLAVAWDVAEELFPSGLIPTLFAAYIGLLERVADDETLWHATTLDLLPPDQQAQRRAVNATAAPLSDALLHTRFIEQATRRPERTAVIAADRTLTYGELLAEASQVAWWLHTRGIGSNQLVATVMDKGWAQVVAVMGVLIAGAAYLPIDPALPAERQRYLIEQGEVRLILTQTGLAERLPGAERMRPLCVDDLASLGLGSLDPALRRAAPSDLAYVIYTSGSTGMPKGVMIDHRGAVNTVEDINRRCQVTAQDRVLALSALNFDLSVYDIFGLLAVGGALVLPAPESRRDPSRWAELMTAHGVTLWNTVPALMQMLMDFQNCRLLACPLRLAMLSGDWIPLDLPERIRALWPTATLMSLGGATEASIWSIGYPIARPDPLWSSVPYGKPLANQTFHVLNERLEPAPVWVPGQLYIGGVGLALGYWRDAAKTAASFIAHPVTGERLYRTGDLGRYLPDGDIEFLGREDFQVKIRGHRIELGEIEYQLVRHPDIREAVVTAHGEGRNDKQLVAYVVAAEEPASQDVTDQGTDALEDMRGVLTDPTDRLQFKLQQHGIRQCEASLPEIALPEPPLHDAAYLERQSYRQFGPQPASLAQLGNLLGCLHPRRFPGAVLPKYRYASAGSLYPIQTYLYVKPGGIRDLAGGYYYYRPPTHRLVQLSADTDMRRTYHSGTNARIFDRSAFSLFLVAEYPAIEPMYGQRARDFCLLEAGYISQLLMMEGPAHDIGLCPIGGLEVEPLRVHCGLTQRQEMLHSFMGGVISEEQKRQLSTTSLPADGLEERLKRHLAQRLPDYMVPGIFVRLPQLPLTANGKLDRQALPSPNLTGFAQAQVAPASELERQLSAMACTVFELKSIGVTDDFLALGADSIQLVQLHSVIGSRLQRKVSIADVFRHSSVRALAAVLEQAEAIAPTTSPLSAMSDLPYDDPEVLDRLAANLDQLSEAEVEQWLARLER